MTFSFLVKENNVQEKEENIKKTQHTHIHTQRKNSRNWDSFIFRIFVRTHFSEKLHIFHKTRTFDVRFQGKYAKLSVEIWLINNYLSVFEETLSPHIFLESTRSDLFKNRIFGRFSSFRRKILTLKL